jgi:natural product precursor
MNRLAIFNEFSLNRAEMKTIKGGYWTASCRCNNGNSWSGSGETMDDFLFYDNYYCGNGGGSCDKTGTLN